MKERHLFVGRLCLATPTQVPLVPLRSHLGVGTVVALRRRNGRASELLTLASVISYRRMSCGDSIGRRHSVIIDGCQQSIGIVRRMTIPV
jgi:hypothetical protein